MAEKLIPFDFEEFKKDPTRLRSGYTDKKPIRASVALDDSVCVVWGGRTCADVYFPDEFHALRLAAKTRVVKVRLFAHSEFDVGAVSGDFWSLDGPKSPAGHRWVSDIIEVEVTE